MNGKESEPQLPVLETREVCWEAQDSLHVLQGRWGTVTQVFPQWSNSA